MYTLRIEGPIHTYQIIRHRLLREFHLNAEKLYFHLVESSFDSQHAMSNLFIKDRRECPQNKMLYLVQWEVPKHQVW